MSIVLKLIRCSSEAECTVRAMEMSWFNKLDLAAVIFCSVALTLNPEKGNTMEKIRALQGENSHGAMTEESVLLAPFKSSLITRASFNTSIGMS